MTSKYRILSNGGKYRGSVDAGDNLARAFQNFAEMLQSHVPQYSITPFPTGYAWELANTDPDKADDVFSMQLLAHGEVPQLSLKRALQLAEEAALEDTQPLIPLTEAQKDVNDFWMRM